MIDPGEAVASELDYPQQRVVVLGASNVARGMQDLVAIARGYLDSPIDLVVAAGHGRSYGSWSSVLWRRLPGLTHCGLWGSLAERPPQQQVSALLTDVGNDLLYGQQPDTILQWVSDVTNRLDGPNSRLVMTELPLSSLQTLGPIRFWAAKSALFPSSPLAYEGFLDKCVRLNEGLRQIAAQHEAHLVVPPGDWYGVDPVHIRRRAQRKAWLEILAPFRSAENSAAARFSSADRRRIRRVRHAHRVWFGRDETRQQPAAFLTEKSIVSMY